MKNYFNEKRLILFAQKSPGLRPDESYRLGKEKSKQKELEKAKEEGQERITQLEEATGEALLQEPSNLDELTHGDVETKSAAAEILGETPEMERVIQEEREKTMAEFKEAGEYWDKKAIQNFIMDLGKFSSDIAGLIKKYTQREGQHLVWRSGEQTIEMNEKDIQNARLLKQIGKAINANNIVKDPNNEDFLLAKLGDKYYRFPMMMIFDSPNISLNRFYRKNRNDFKEIHRNDFVVGLENLEAPREGFYVRDIPEDTEISG